MKRLIDQELSKWKVSSNRKLLMLRGAREVGKTFAVRKLGESYLDYYEVNLEKRVDLHSVFEKDLDPERILRELSIDRGAPIWTGETLLFFDEIQACPRAISSLRSFYEEMRELHVIGAGSMLDFAKEQIGLPVECVQTLTVYPMSFVEFLSAKGEMVLLEAICEQSISEVVRNKATQFLAEYLMVGGLPKMVANWVASGGQTLEGKDKLSALMSTYQQDFEKYARKSQHKYFNSLFQQIPFQIGQKFAFQTNGEYRKRELAPCLELMEKAHIVHRIYCASGQGVPLDTEANWDKYKVIFFDVALAQQLGLDMKEWFFELVESFVGQEMMAYASANMRQMLFYWQRDARGSEAEAHYLSTINGAVIPVKVKARKGSTSKSLLSFLSTHPKSPYAIQISLSNKSNYEKIVSIPPYAVFKIVEGGVEKVRSLL